MKLTAILPQNLQTTKLHAQNSQQRAAFKPMPYDSVYFGFGNKADYDFHDNRIINYPINAGKITTNGCYIVFNENVTADHIDTSEPQNSCNRGKLIAKKDLNAGNVFSGNTELNNATIKGKLSTTGLTVTGDLNAGSVDTVGTTTLNNATIKGKLTSLILTTTGDLNAGSVNTKHISKLKNATIKGDIKTNELSVTGDLNAENVYSGYENVFNHPKTTLNNATIKGKLVACDLESTGNVTAESIISDKADLNEVKAEYLFCNDNNIKVNNISNIISSENIKLGDVKSLNSIAIIKNDDNEKNICRDLTFNEMPEKKISVLLDKEFNGIFSIHTPTGDNSILEKLDFFNAVVQKTKNDINVTKGEAISKEQIGKFIKKGLIQIVKIAK